MLSELHNHHQNLALIATPTYVDAMAPHPHDRLFKRIFEDREHAAGQLRSMLPGEVAEPLDWQTLELCSGSFVDPALVPHHTDLLFSIAWHDRSRARAYLLFEHQSTTDGMMPFRLLRYLVRIWDRWHNANQLVNKHISEAELQTFAGRVAGPAAEEAVVTAGQRLRQEGIEEGFAQGERKMLLRQLRQRFGSEVDANVEQRVATASTKQVHIWIARILSATSLGGVLADEPQDLP